MATHYPRTLFDKLWQAHVVHEEPDIPTLVYIDLHLIHEVTSPQAFDGLRRRGVGVRRPERTVATVDHSIPTFRMLWLRNRYPRSSGMHGNSASRYTGPTIRNGASCMLSVRSSDSRNQG